MWLAGSPSLGEGSSTLRDALRDLVKKDHKKILLNLGEVTYIDSSGIGELVSAYTTITNQGGHLKLLSLTHRVKDLLQNHQALHRIRRPRRRGSRRPQLRVIAQAILTVCSSGQTRGTPARAENGVSHYS